MEIDKEITNEIVLLESMRYNTYLKKYFLGSNEHLYIYLVV